MLTRLPLVLWLLVLCSACDLAAFAANSTAGVFERAGPAFNEHWDYEFAGEAAPGGVMQLEGLHRVIPDNEVILLSAARGYVGYAYGYVEDQIERNDPMNLEREEQLKTRARWMYLRARYFAFRLLRQRHDGFDEAREAGLEAFQRWLQEEFDDEEDAEELFWAGYTWGSAINVSREDPNMIADLSFARAMIEREVELDPSYFNAGGVTFMAVINASFPEALGGNPERGRELFERALELTDRKFLLIQYNYARTYAVQTNNREMFDQLIAEVLEAGDISAENRLPNKIAQRRARWLRSQADQLFY
jgi:hypothetical protein